MSMLAIAKKDFRSARRSKMLWGVTITFTVVIAGIILMGSTGPDATETAMSTMVGVGTFFLPLAVIVMTYLAITGERESERIKYLLGLPSTRLSVVAGKFLGRTLVAIVGITIAFLVGALVTWAHTGTLPTVEYAQFLLLTVYFTAVWSGVAVGVSALSDTRGKALAGTLGVYFGFVIMYVAPIVDIQRGLAYIVEDVLGLGSIPALYDLSLAISPAYAYSFAANVLVRGVEFQGEDYIGSYGGDVPFFLEPWFSLVILLIWLVAPLVIGYTHFRRAEIG